MLDFDQVLAAIVAAKRRFELICEKYPSLRYVLQSGEVAAYLVLSLPGGQIVTKCLPMKIFHQFPGMIVEDDTKARALELQARIELLELRDVTGPETERLKSQLQQLSPHFKYKDECQVEIRFNDLTYDLVWKLQGDELVDRELTPQTKASIRIVLGTIAQFARLYHEHKSESEGGE